MTHGVALDRIYGRVRKCLLLLLLPVMTQHTEKMAEQVPSLPMFSPHESQCITCGHDMAPPLVFQGVRTSQLPEYQRQLIERLTK